MLLLDITFTDTARFVLREGDHVGNEMYRGKTKSRWNHDKPSALVNGIETKRTMKKSQKNFTNGKFVHQ